MSNYARNIEILCTQRGFTIYQLADELGIDYTDIIRPNTDVLVKLSTYFKTGIDALVQAHLYKKEEIQKLDIKMLVTDVDGVLTDNGLYYSENGDEIKKFNAKDGLALKELSRKGIITGIISNSRNKQIIETRAALLKFNWWSVDAEGPKLTVLKKKCKELDIKISQVAYIGDDLNDMEVMVNTGLSVCPADAAKEIQQVSRVILKSKGGEGCVREFIDEYLG